MRVSAYTGLWSLSRWARDAIRKKVFLYHKSGFRSEARPQVTYNRATYDLGKYILGATGLVGISYLIYAPQNWKHAVNSDAPASPSNTSRMYTYDEVKRHSTERSLWVIIHGKVYDLTGFLPVHPGGPAIILSNAAKDVTAIFDAHHSQRFLTTMLTPEQCLGDIDAPTVPQDAVIKSGEGQRIVLAHKNKRPIHQMINLDDFENVAETVLTKTAWAYYSGAAEDDSSHRNNLSSYSRYWFRPRALRKTRDVDTSTTFLGIPTSLPVFVCPAALAGLGSPDGEVPITRGAAVSGIVQCVSNNSTCTVEEIAAVKSPDQTLFFQLYIHPNHENSAEMVRKVERLGFRGIILTADTPALGKRESDMRTMAAVSVSLLLKNDAELGVARGLGSFFDENLGWEVMSWLKTLTKLPIIVKGVQCVEDVVLAYEHGAQGVILSNHGASDIYIAPASIDILWELRQERPDMFEKMDIFIDGGVRRGSDVLKALCLGAKGVGMGRPFLYANSAYGRLIPVSWDRRRVLKGYLPQGRLGLSRLSQVSATCLVLIHHHNIYPGGFH
ncbi:FMN-dependent dehydrogenase-domain-containing protein [Cantharellus anzutake]|uniref:FMN-dependent dehydrogenase-domain-containing protein n=1 Tax=Cantharellus anzutake TaxID=1750568 RepID=UPI0019036118|nr:FMN-dependent dehydrogenase-domain-containing protein [Cantharellus anzutake]KAF8338945.1 FMN-dependent dehydrogenase-domain-containing protein [Cantharellus anzutake]